MTRPRGKEVRLLLPIEVVAVLDAYCIATGQTRTAAVRKILREWLAEHACTSGLKPTLSAPDRSDAA